jgi:hypothetical protein
MNDVLGAIERARSVQIASYILEPGRLVEALAAAGDRGASVHVRLESAPIDDARRTLAKRNAEIAAQLRSHGVVVELTAQQSHLKAAVVDGRAFLDDRNWPGAAGGADRNTIVSDADPDDVRVVSRAIAGRTGSDPHLWTRKFDALRAEARLLHGAGVEPIAVESESFGPGIIASELQRAAEAGADVRLLVCNREVDNARESTALQKLAAAGVDIRTASFDEKMAIVGSQAWLGSANATMYPFDQIDWGLRTRVPQVVRALRERFEESWAHATDLQPR